MNTLKQGLLTTALLMGLVGSSQATVFTWNFSASNTCAVSPATPVALCNSNYNGSTITFADTTANYDIVARGYDISPNTSPPLLIVGSTDWIFTTAPTPNDNLYGKYNGSGESGVGLENPDAGGANEIEKGNFLQLDFTALVSAGFDSVDLSISSLQTNETATIWGSNTVGQPGTLLADFTGGSVIQTFHYDLLQGSYLTVSANPNVDPPNDNLIQSGFTATKNVPEPATLALLGLALVGLAVSRRRTMS